MQYLFQHSIPVAWLLADILTILVSLLVVIFIVQRSKHPVVVLLECFGFIFLYASIYENFAVVQGWYIYGRSLLMVGDVPFSVPLIEMDVLITSLWLLEKMKIPEWCKPFIVGLFGMLQDLSLDPLSVRQVFTVGGVTTGRWTWLLKPGMVNIFNVPVYNFSGWMLIMMYASAWFLVGRWWFRRSGYKPVIGYIYPLLASLLGLLTLVSPLSKLLLWLAPFFTKGSNAEWAMLAFHLVFPVLLLAVFWKGRMKSPFTIKGDLPIIAVIVTFHLSDIIFTIAGGFNTILWLIVVVSAVHITLLGLIYFSGKKFSIPAEGLLFEP